MLAGLAIWFTVTKLELDTSQRALISSENRLMQLLEVADQFSEHDAFIVAIENRDVRRTLEFVSALAPKLEADRQHFAEVFFRVDPAHFRPWALLYLSPKELADLRSNLLQHKSFIKNLSQSPGLVKFFEEVNNEMASHMIGQLFTGFLEPSSEEGKGEPMDLDFLLRVLREMKANIEGSSSFTSPWNSFFSKVGWTAEPEEGYFWTNEKKYLLIFVSPNTQGSGGSTEKDALTALRQHVAAVKQRFPDIEAGVTGQKALNVDEMNMALNDMSIVTIISIISLGALLVLFWRTVRRPLLQLTTQMVSLSFTFGLTTLLIGHLNLLSITFAPIVLGLGIDYDIHWFSRYNEERQRKGQSIRQALSITMERTGPAILVAALSTCLAFFPLALTGFKGLSELGIICGMGLLVSSITSICLLPALIVLFDRPRPYMPLLDDKQEVKPLVRITKQRAIGLLVLAAFCTGLSLWGARKIKFDLNMLHLQSKDAESVIWETKLIEGSKYPSIYGVLFAHSLAEVATKTKALKKLPTVSEVQSIEDFLPQDQAHKISLLRGMKPLLADIPSTIPRPAGPIDIAHLEDVFSRIRFKMENTSAKEWGVNKPIEAQMKEVCLLIDTIKKDFRSIGKDTLLRLKQFERHIFEDLNDKLSLLRENIDTRPMQISDLPQPIRERFVGPDNLYLIRVFPAMDIWDPQFLGVFVEDLRRIDPDVTGDPVTLYVFTKEFRDSSIKAAIYALIFIFVFLLLMLRNVAFTLAAITPLILGALWTFGLMYLFGMDLNLANTIFLPLVIGAGVEYGVIVVERWRQGKKVKEQAILPVSTGMGVLLAGLTTTIGFASLMISRHQGIHSLGLLTTIGSLTVITVTILFLPALLYLIPNNKSGRIENNDGEP